MKFFKPMLTIILICALAAIAVVAACNFIVIRSTKGRIYDDVAQVPHREVGLLLGTSPVARYGGTNIYFTYRIDAAAKLYKAKKISRILISGDGNNSKGYDEPLCMKQCLVQQGVPANVITLDRKGLRTYDSVTRARDVYGVNNFTVISQQFHNERTIFLAKHHDVEAIGFNAKDAPYKYGIPAIKVKIRELFAKVKVFTDII